MMDRDPTKQDEGAGTALEALRSGQALVQRETWEREPELMGLLEEALNLYWECFDRLSEHEIGDDVEETLIYLSAAAFQTLQSCFELIESGHYRQATVLIRLMMNECLLCNKFRLDPESATTFLSGSNWSTVQGQAQDLLPRLDNLEGYPRQLATHLSSALRKRYPWTAYVAAQQLVRPPTSRAPAITPALERSHLPGESTWLSRTEQPQEDVDANPATPWVSGC